MLVAFSADCLWISWRSNHLKSAQLNLRTIEDSERRVRGSLKDARATDTRDAIECQRSVRCVCVCNRHSYRFISCHTHTHMHIRSETDRQLGTLFDHYTADVACLARKAANCAACLCLRLLLRRPATAPPTSSNEAARHLVKYFALN